MISLVAVSLLTGSAQTFDLLPRLASGRTIVLNSVEERFEGKAKTTLGTRFEIVAGATPSSFELSTGPFTAMGRTFGRKKTKTLGLTPKGTLMGDVAGRPPFLLSVPLPGRPVKIGDTWTGSIVGPTPTPAGMKATFRALGVTKVAGFPCLKVSAKIDWGVETKIAGTGQMTIRLDDGFIQTGSLNVLLVYRRPDPVTRVMKENSRVTVKARIVRSS